MAFLGESEIGCARMIGHILFINNGNKKFVSWQVTRDMVGHKIGFH